MQLQPSITEQRLLAHLLEVNLYVCCKLFHATDHLAVPWRRIVPSIVMGTRGAAETRLSEDSLLLSRLTSEELGDEEISCTQSAAAATAMSDRRMA